MTETTQQLHFRQQYWSGGYKNDLNPCPACNKMLALREPVVNVTTCGNLDDGIWPWEVNAILCQPCGEAAAAKAGQTVKVRNPSKVRGNPYAEQIAEWDKQAEAAKAEKEARAAKARQRKRG